MDKQQIEEKLKVKKEELSVLQADVLSDIQKKKKEELEKDIKDLEDQLEKLKTLETSAETDKTKKETTILKEDIGTSKKLLAYIQDTEMKNKLDELEKTGDIPDFTVEKFAKDISSTVDGYLKEAFKISGTEDLNISENVLSSLSIGIQFSMMQALAESGEEGTQFIDDFSTTDTDNAVSTFTNLTSIFTKTFKKAGDTNKFYTLAKKVESCISFIARYSGEGKTLGDGTKVKEMANANEFRKLLDKDIWGNDELLLAKNPTDTDIGLTISDDTIPEMSDTDLAELKAIADNEDLPINAKTIKAIQAALPTAQSFLEKRASYKNKAMDIMESFKGFLDKDIMGFGSLGSIIGITDPMELFVSKDKKKKGGVMNFVLKIMGFHNGMEGLYQEYIRQDIDKNLTEDERDFIKDVMDAYTDASKETYTGKETTDLFDLTSLDETTKAKIPSNYEYIKDALFSTINSSSKTLSFDVTILQNAFSAAGKTLPTTTNDEGKIIIDEDVFEINDITEEIIDAYLKLYIPILIENTDFMAGIESSEQFVVTLAGNLVCGTSFISGVALGIETLPSYEDIPTTEKEGNVDSINGQVDFSKANFKEEQIKNINFLIDEMNTLNITNPYTQIGILSVISKECGFIPKAEFGYSTTSNARIRELFTTRVSKYSDAELDALKKDDEKFFDVIYGKDAAGKWADHTEVGDGYTYRGRGFNQITFKASYKKYGDLIGEDLVSNPDLLNDPEIASKAALAFFKQGNGGKDLADLSFTNKEDAARYFARINGGNVNRKSKHEIYAVNASAKFDVVSKTGTTVENNKETDTTSEKTETLTAKEHTTYKEDVFFIGDSITAGYADTGDRDYNSLGDFVKKSLVADGKTEAQAKKLGQMGGKRTKRMKDNFLTYLEDTPKDSLPKTIFLLGGVNDLTSYALSNYLNKNKDNTAGVLTAQQIADKIYDNLEAIKTAAEEKGITCVMGTVLPFASFIKKQDYASEADVALEAQKILNTKIKGETPYIDFYKEFDDPDNPGSMNKSISSDGLHPYNGYDTMQTMVQEKRKELSVA